jgi:hypothetical protein
VVCFSFFPALVKAVEVVAVASVEADSAVAEVTVAGSLDKFPIKYYIFNKTLNQRGK